MGASEERLLGQLAVKLNLITLDQLATATKAHGRPGNQTPLGEVLVELGFIGPSDLQSLLLSQKRVLERIRTRDGAPAAAAPIAAAEPRDEAVRAERLAPAEPAPSPRPAASQAPPSSGAVDALLTEAAHGGASDVHIHAGAVPRLRIRGELTNHGTSPLDPATAEEMALSTLTPEQRDAFEAAGEIDFCYAIEGVGRFRANLYRQLHGTDGVFRFIPGEIPTLDRLGLPAHLAKLTTFHQGIVLVTGPASSGKSSTLAALVNLINDERAEHILTIEDPIEYLHTSRRCLVNQRSIEQHTQSFARALRAALREDPDVIVIGELRDAETISLALTAAETGHLVMATLHTDSAIRTINRLIGAFPPSQQDQARTMLAESLRGVVSQRLLPRADGTGQVPATEILFSSKAVGKMIRDNRTFQIGSVLQTGGSQGMWQLDDSLATLVRNGVVSPQDARLQSEDPRRIPEAPAGGGA